MAQSKICSQRKQREIYRKSWLFRLRQTFEEISLGKSACVIKSDDVCWWRTAGIAVQDGCWPRVKHIVYRTEVGEIVWIGQSDIRWRFCVIWLTFGEICGNIQIYPWKSTASSKKLSNRRVYRSAQVQRLLQIAQIQKKICLYLSII